MKNTAKKDFKTELEKLIAKNGDSILANYINDCLKQYNQDNYTNNSENLFGVDISKIPETPQISYQSPQPIPAKVGNNTSSGWNNPFGGTSWGI